MSKKFWKWAKDEVSSNGSELILDGVIADESWFGDEVTPAVFRSELAAHSGNITVRINSPGGDVFAGIAIYNALIEHDGNVTVKVDGLAASIASVIAMAGDEIIMLPGAMMMVHEPWTIAMGNADDLTEVAETLQKMGESIIPIYAARTGQSEDKIRELLKAETWMDGKDAVELGFATEAVEAKSTVSASIKNAMSYASTVKEAVMQPAMALSTKFKSEDPTPAETPEEVEETNVPDTTETTEEDVQPEEPAESTPESETEEVEPEAEEPAEAPAEVNNSVEKDPKNMETKEKTETIAKSQVIEPKKQAKVEAKNSANYLSTMAAVEDYAKVLKANAGRSAEDVRSAWKKVLVKNGLTDADYFQLPEPVITSINDAVKTSGIYSLLNKTGLDVWKTVWDSTSAEADTSRAGGHQKGDTKSEQVLTFDKRVLRPGVIYKYLVLDKETIREQKSTGALVKFVLNELPTRIIREIERAVVIGDGRADDADRKISSFISIKSDVVANNSFAASYTPAAGETRYESVAKAKDKILAEGSVYLVAKKGYSTSARFEKDTDGRFLFPVGTSAADVFDVAGVIEPTWLTDTTDPEYDAYLVVFSDYKTVGDNSVEAFTNFKLETNENEFLQEIYQGGGLDSLKAAVGIAASASS